MPTVHRLFHQAKMELRLDDDRLTAMAFAALEEVAAHCKYWPHPKSRSLALVLAYLASQMHSEADRFPFDNFWQWIEAADRVSRDCNVQAATNGIYRAVLINRDKARSQPFEDRARVRAEALVTKGTMRL